MRPLGELVGSAEVVADDPHVLLVLARDGAEPLALLDRGQVADADRRAGSVGHQRRPQFLEASLPGARGLEVHLDLLAADVDALGTDRTPHLARHRGGEIARREAVRAPAPRDRGSRVTVNALSCPQKLPALMFDVAHPGNPLQPLLEVERQPLDAVERVAQQLDPVGDAAAAAVPRLKPGPLPCTDTLAPPISTARWVSCLLQLARQGAEPASFSKSTCMYGAVAHRQRHAPARPQDDRPRVARTPASGGRG